MKCKIPEISWHNRDPVLSVDIQPRTSIVSNSSQTYRLASGGTDGHVLIWYLNLAIDGSDIDLDLAADLTRHQRAVNVVKWSPNGEFLASGDDESVVFIWSQKSDSDPLNILETHSDQDKEVWIAIKVLRGHMEDVYDVSWSPNSQYLVSGSVDNSAIVWDVQKGKSLAILNDHKGFVQGVAWDPKNQYIATLSTDRFLRIFDIQSKRVLHRVNKSALPVSEDHPLHGHRLNLFHDDTLQTFFRRLSFTPDGKLLLTPAGVADHDDSTHPLHTTYAFSRYAFRQPSVVLPCPDQYTVAVCCCPLLFKLRPHNPDKNPPVVPLPYRMIFAVATRCSVFFYDTQQAQPFALISNIHYTRLTDVTWSSDGRVMVVSSTDGFCSLITFEVGELGEEYENSADVLSSGMFNEVTTLPAKKSKKQKENDIQESKDRQKSGGEKMEIDVASESIREPLVQTSVKNQETPTKGSQTRLPSAKIASKVCGEESSDNSMQPDVDSPMKSESDASVKFDSLENAQNTLGNASAIIVGKALPAEVILDKEILSCEEKFDSPEKKCCPATPITVRRHPRTPKSAHQTTPTESTTMLKLSNLDGKASPLTSIKHTESPIESKRATPIAIRRTPRTLVPKQATAEPPILSEEAVDAWPIPLPASQPDEDDPSPNREPSRVASATPSPKSLKLSALLANVPACDSTEDIKLVYEDSNNTAAKPETHADGKSAELCTVKGIDESKKGTTQTPKGTPNQKPRTPSSSTKTPRRVPLTTISTPKSKKKLL